MTYLVLDLVVLAAVAVATALLLARVPAADRRPVLRAMAATALVIGALTAVFDSAMIAAGLFTYAEEHLLGPRIGLAPVEDFAYPLAAAALLPALWTALGRRDRREGDR